MHKRILRSVLWQSVALLGCVLSCPAHALQAGIAQQLASNNVSGPAAADPAAPVAADASRDAGTSRGTLNFVDADIESVIAAVGDYTHTTFIIDPRIKGTLTLVSEKPLTQSQAFELLASVLRLRGYAIVKGNGYSKVVPEAEAKLQGGPLQSQRSGSVRGDQIATQIFHLNFESAASLVPVLRPLITPNNTISANPGNNTLVITDYADNLMRLGKIIASLDGPPNSDLNVVPIRYAIATDIAVMVNRLLDASSTPGNKDDSIAVLAYPRTNSVLIRAASDARANLARALIEKLDQPTTQPGDVHVVYLKNADATQLAQTLRAVVTSDASAISSTSISSPQLASGTNKSATSASTATTHTTLSSGGAGGFIQADAATNTLIITASDAVYRNLRNVIDQLDARRAQVYIESLIVEVDANKAAELGVQWAAMTGNANSTYRVGGITGFSSSGNNLINQAAANASGTTLAPGNGLTLGILNHTGLGALVHALESDSSANILSMPNLITLDNEEAKIVVGQNVPFITGQYTTAVSTGSATISPFQTVERKDIGLTLKVKPQISQGGTVKMAIYQETSAIQDSTNSAGLITSKRSLDTNVVVDDGQIIVLGGLIDDNVQDSVEKVPVLGDIPILGSLFRYKKRTHAKTNLMVFLRPTIIRNTEQSVDLSSDRYDYIRSQQENAKPGQISNDALKLPALQDGKVADGLLAKQPPSGPASPGVDSSADTKKDAAGDTPTQPSTIPPN